MILEQHLRGRITIVLSRQVLDEVVSTIRRKRPEIMSLLETFLTMVPPELCIDPDAEEVERVSSFINPSDAPILAAAVKSGADCLVTGNTRHFTSEVARRAKMAIHTPAAYVALLTAGSRESS